MKKRTAVSKIMSKDLISVNETNSVKDVVEIFSKNDIHHVPVVSGKSLKGLISKSDIDRISFITNTTQEKANTQVYESLSLDQVMVSNLESVGVDNTIKEAAEKLATGSIHALPVLEGEDLVGIVTSTDLINFLIEQY